ncbi:MAG: cbb3-type cytochrome oxidase subunit 3 [Gemmatimonadales bacterium]
MRLTDIMSGSGLSGYAIVALVLFMAAFIAIVVSIFLPSRKREFDQAGRLPLDDGQAATTPEGGPR